MFTAKTWPDTVQESRRSSRFVEMACQDDITEFGSFLGRGQVGAEEQSVRSKVKHFLRSLLQYTRSNDVIRVWCEYEAIYRQKNREKDV